ncbi:Kunitz/Bovine pancreatic trypsin inhibitor domain protein [Trichostrongylus colubriformis]|uniref:Kunitz/Bovine pancreatic trypsin inhibitor domain protein n=1 Tax=Trichostrongylus colubriformis TaxID=6319 RepID=A0AAN8FXN7_TRICO
MLLLMILCALPFSFALDCMLPKDVGTECEQPSQRMFYYDSRYKVCQPFLYRGCGGNTNRFASSKECKEACPGGGKEMKSNDAPSEAALAGSDAVFVPRGTSHDQWMKAEKCGSNYLIPNAQYIHPNPSCPPNHELMNGVCCPTKDFVCSLRDDSGSFVDGIEDRPRFSWNHAVNSCERFSYFGANGNYNNFPSFYSCLNYCKESHKL